MGGICIRTRDIDSIFAIDVFNRMRCLFAVLEPETRNLPIPRRVSLSGRRATSILGLGFTTCTSYLDQLDTRAQTESVTLPIEGSYRCREFLAALIIIDPPHQIRRVRSQRQSSSKPTWWIPIIDITRPTGQTKSSLPLFTTQHRNFTSTIIGRKASSQISKTADES